MPAILLLVLMMDLLFPPMAKAEVSAEDVEQATSFAEAGDAIDPALIRLQVLLDRSRFSPGVIDGPHGENVANGLDADGKPDEALLAKLTAEDQKPVLARYTIRQEDVDGPFLEAVPETLEEMAKLEALSFTSARELLAEKFHMDEDLLAALNPGADLSRAGTEITVARVNQREEKETVVRIEVDKAKGALLAYGEDGALAAFYPATIGSEGMPSPTGTPEPSLIAKSQSHGCVRLTNWDAEELSKLVKTGTSVTFLD
jgi:hypothetical protein